ncbi:MAG TPA: SDR family oxidoreductase [Spongiibacteraceae bacterium]|nr:SDR family oxidoreductase [Spongiibacteraceae bacterium]
MTQVHTEQPHAQKQDTQPGREAQMQPQPLSIRESYRGSGKLKGKVAFISGGDSGIGRSVALHFAREGAQIGIFYLEEDEDAKETQRLVEREGRRCLLYRGDVRSAPACRAAIEAVLAEFGQLDVLVNNAGEQHTAAELEDISIEQLHRTFETNLFGYFYMTQAALPHLHAGAVIINTGSVTAFRGSKRLIDYASTKGAIQSFTFSLAESLGEKRIRVNGVAPGPVWTPLIAATFSAEEIEKFGTDTLLKRAAQPAEIGPAYVFLASEDASYITGQFIHINGGAFIAA